MNYWKDTCSGKVYFACAFLTCVDDPKEPPTVVQIPDLFTEERFQEVAPNGDPLTRFPRFEL